MRFKLTINYPGNKPLSVTLTKPKTIIGRGSNTDIRVISAGLSRQHIMFETIDDKLYITDLNSSNGTTVGENKLRPNEKTHYDTYFMPIQLGSDVQITVEEVPF